MKRLSRAEYRAEQSQLLDEQEALEAAQTDEDNTPVWRDTGETVRERWERLSPAERRLWLLRIGVTFTLYRDERPGAYRWRVVTSWREAGDAGQAAYRERFVRVGEAG